MNSTIAFNFVKDTALKSLEVFRDKVATAPSRVGRTSVTFDQVVFSQGRCVASALSVNVLLDESTRKPTPLTAEILANFQPWLRRGGNVA